MARFARVAILAALALPAAALAQTAYTRKTVNLRAGPSVEYPVVSRVPPGAAVQVFGCLDDWTWCDAAWGPERGWVYAGNLFYPYQGHDVAIRWNGPVIGLPVIVFSVGPYWDAYYRTRPWYGRRSYWIGRPPPPHWGYPSRPPRPRPPTVQPVPRPPRPRPPAIQPVPRPPAPRPPAPRPPAPRPPAPRPRITPRVG